METISERERESEHFLGAFGVKAGLEEDGRIVTGKGQERMGWGQKDKAFRVLYIGWGCICSWLQQNTQTCHTGMAGGR